MLFGFQERHCQLRHDSLAPHLPDEERAVRGARGGVALIGAQTGLAPHAAHMETRRSQRAGHLRCDTVHSTEQHVVLKRYRNNARKDWLQLQGSMPGRCARQ